MRLTSYRHVLARPGVLPLGLTMVAARIPLAATGLVLTLHVVQGRDHGGLGLGYAAAGVAVAAMAGGGAVGAPLLGRAIDRVGLRPVLALTTAVSTVFWSVASVLPFPALLSAGALAGVFGMPVFSLMRQALAVMLPVRDRRAGMALDTMSAEISFIAGPVLGAVLVIQLGPPVAMPVLALGIAVSGVALLVVDPPVRETADRADPALDAAGPVRTAAWLTARVGAVLLATAGGTLVFSATDLALTAAMRSFDAVGLIGLVLGVWAIGSVVGAFVYGATDRRWDPVVLLAVVGALIMPVSLATSWVVLAVLMVPAALFCGPLVSTSAEQMISDTPATVRGEVMGAHTSALTFGGALGTPLAGIIIDATSARAGLRGVGGLGRAVALVGLGARAVPGLRRAAADARPGRGRATRRGGS